MFLDKIFLFYIRGKLSGKAKNMRTGRYSYNAQQRSIIRPMKKVQELAQGFAENYDCVEVRLCGENAIASSAVMAVSTAEEAKIAFYRACNLVFARKGSVKSVNVSFLWPQESEEELTAKLTGYLAELCKSEGAFLGAVTASVSSFVSKGILMLQVIGTVPEQQEAAEPKEGYTLCMAGHAGMAGIGLLAVSEEEALTKQYTRGFIRQAQHFLNDLSLRPVKEALGGIESCIYPMQEGGILNALWNFADGVGVGLDIDMRKIPIHQESVEISEFYGINPYQLLSDGACLIASRQPEKVCAELERAGIVCRIIGHITKENARVIRRDDEVRYLDKPGQEELEKIRQEQIR